MKKKQPPNIDPDILYKFINPYDPDANEEWTTAFSIQTKLHTALMELTRPHGTGNPPSLDIPFNEMKARPDVCRRYKVEISKLLRLVQDRIPKGPVDPTALGALNLRRVAKRLTAITEFTRTTSQGEDFRSRQSRVAKVGGKIISEKAAPFKAAVLAERDRLLKGRKVPPSERSMASIIATKLHRSFNTVRDVLRKNRG